MIFGQILKSCRPKRIAKADENFANRLDLKDIKFPVKTGHSHKIEKKKFISISVCGYENKEQHPIYVLKKCSEEKQVD